MTQLAILITSYKEGTLIQGTIRSTINLPGTVFVAEGGFWNQDVEGEPTDVGFGNRNNLIVWNGTWESETAKRNEMLNRARERYEKDFWILTIDADEILVWGEYLVDWLRQLSPGYPESQENIVPMKRTEDKWNKKKGFFHTDIAPSRLIHSSVIERYEVGTLRFRTPDNKEGSLHHYSSPKPPIYGEPHIHHRHYLRRGERAVYRAAEQEEKVWRENQAGATIQAFDPNGNPIQVESS